MRVHSPMALGQLIRAKRTARGLTQAELAAAVSVSRKWIVDLERGKPAVDLSLVLRTLRALDIELDARDRSARPASEGAIDLDAIIDASRRGSE